MNNCTKNNETSKNIQKDRGNDTGNFMTHDEQPQAEKIGTQLAFVIFN